MAPSLDFIGDELAGADDEEMDVEADPVHTPNTPHPDSIQPLPPPGKPPALMRNKRTHDASTPSSPPPDRNAANGMDEVELAATGMDEVELVEASVSGMAEARSAASESQSSSTETSGEEGEVRGEGRSTLARARRARRRLQLDSPPAPEHACPPAAPVAGPPPGPPPQMLAPPPPSGPPPSLPLGPGVKRRGVPPDPSELLAESSGCSLEELGKRRRQRASEEMDASSGSRSRGSHSDSEEGDASYNAAPPSARWVWDRLLKQHADADDDSGAAAALLERRALRAFEKLHADA